MAHIDWDRPKVLKGAICMKFECSEEATHILESPQGMIFYQCLAVCNRTGGRTERKAERGMAGNNTRYSMCRIRMYFLATLHLNV